MHTTCVHDDNTIAIATLHLDTVRLLRWRTTLPGDRSEGTGFKRDPRAIAAANIQATYITRPLSPCIATCAACCVEVQHKLQR